jgi:hypothetical protein
VLNAAKPGAKPGKRSAVKSLIDQKHLLSDRDLLVLLIDLHQETETRIMKTLADVQAALGDLSTNVENVRVAVAAGFAGAAPVDLQPALDQIATIEAQVAAIPTHG